MANQQHNSSLLDLLPDTIVDLYEVDLGEQDGIFRLHPGIISTEQIVFSGKIYHSLPVDASGFERNADGKMSRPTLVFANPDGLISDVLKNRKDLVGVTIVRKRVFLKFIDSSNFPNNFNPFAIPDPNARFDDEIFIVNKKVVENKFFVEFELVSPIEFEEVKLPARVVISNYCPWKYRGAGCLYGQRSNFENAAIRSIKTNYFGTSTATGAAVETYGKVTPTNINNGTFIFRQGIDQELGNLGFPLADRKNKLFFSEEGYNIDRINWAGDYNKNAVAVSMGAVGAGANSLINLQVTALSAGIPAGRTILFVDAADNTTEVPFRVYTSASKGDTSIYGYIVREGGAGLSGYSSGSTKYMKGDIVRIKSRFKNLSKIELVSTTQNLIDEPDSFFVCIKDATPDKDPRLNPEYWAHDQCSKDLCGCKIRYRNYGDYDNGMPFGGFPATEAFRYR